MSTYFVGIDCGTQSAKVEIFDAHGASVAVGNRPLRAMRRPRHGVVQHPDDDTWDAIAEACKHAMANFPHDPSRIAAIGVCPIRCCKAFLAADGSLIEPVMSWMDDRAYEPYIPNDPALAFVTTLSGYITHRLTGQCKDTAANNIVGQWPIDPIRWDWDANDRALTEFGVRREQLFDLILPGDVVGPLTAQAAAATGLPPGVPVVATANDKAVEMLGAGPIGESTVLVSLGTYIAAMVPGSDYRANPQKFWTNFASIPERYVYESNGVRRGMWTLTWFLDLLGPEFASAAETLGVSRESLLEREANLVPAGSDGLMTVLDWLAPGDAPFRKGTMLGFDARHTRAHIYRSILEAIALTMKTNVDAMCAELGVTATNVVLSGGGAKSALFTQIFADVFGLPASRSTGAAGAGLGSAMCAAAAVGAHADLDAACAAMASNRETFAPNPASTARYDAMLQTVYPHIRSATDPLFKRAYPLFHETGPSS